MINLPLEKYRKKTLFNTEIETLNAKHTKTLQKILIIGPQDPSRLVYLAHNLYMCFKKLGYEVKYFSRNTLNASIQVRNRRKYFMLSNLLQDLDEWVPDFIFVEQDLIFIQNTTGIPSAYHHREYRRPHEFYYPTIEYCNQPNLLEFYEQFNERMWCSQVPYRKLLPLAYNPQQIDYIKQKDKLYKGISFIGPREPYEVSLERGELTRYGTILLNQLKAQAVKPYIDTFFETGKGQYKEIVQNSEMIFIPISYGQHFSRSILEAMASGTQVIIKIQSEEQEQTIKEEYKLIQGEHYIGIQSYKELIDIEFKEEIVKKAYKVIKDNHTYMHRTKQIIEDFYHVL
ncbi:MAG: hypothetical protein GF317_14295 [Candidatus Lokiarchaeota archaeon]|nr:hypothetical protein [Candidatus Lokiarchaeota archaeon]